jgi:putative membrane protein
MKKLFLMMAVSGAVLSFQACSNNANNTTDADTTSMATDTMMMNADADMLTDTAFANKAAVGGMAEVEMGKLALEKATNTKLKDFASMMVNDHGKANAELKTIAEGKNMMLPTALDQEHTSKMEELKTKSGADFDKAYAEAMVEGHEKTLDLMEDGKNLADAQLKAFAEKTGPVVKQHLDLIKSIRDELK